MPVVVGYLVAVPGTAFVFTRTAGAVLYRASLVESHWRPPPSGRQVVLSGSDANLPEKLATAVESVA